MNKDSSSSLSTDIAIVGMAALFPGARDIETYWQNILNKVNAVQDAPDDWAVPYYDPDANTNDRIYTRKGGFLGELAEFNPVEFGIMPSSVDGGEPDHFLALKVASAALKDSGYANRPFNREKAGIILGRGTYINRAYSTLLQHGQIIDQTMDLLKRLNPSLPPETLQEIRKQLKASLPPFTTEMAPGLVPNVLTGRIANRLDLMGPNYIVDAACASSLIATQLAIQELISGRCDLVLTGGVHASTPPQIYMIFNQLGALSRDRIAPFSDAAGGTLLGAGLGIIVLKRLADAERDGDRIYALIKGVGTSSDGKALGLLAPRIEGEVLALQRAYAESRVDPETVELIEAHGTGIPLGDRTEVQSLTQMFGQRLGDLPTCALGSVKSMIGHCLPAAGAASLIKTALSLYHKVLPPTLCDQVNLALELEKTPFYINTEARPWIHSDAQIPRRAGVNAFGFGGINAHAVLEEYKPPIKQDSKLRLHQLPTELLIFSSQSWQDLLTNIQTVRELLQLSPQTSLANLAYTLSKQPLGSDRLAIVAKDIPDLQTKLDQVIDKWQNFPPKRLQTRNGIYYDRYNDESSQKTAFLFPGEGSQYQNMLADLCLYFPQVRAWFDFLDATLTERRSSPPSQIIFPPPNSISPETQYSVNQQLFNMDVGSESVFTASMALYELLQDFGIQCDVMVGHSTGENAALIASGTMRLTDKEELMSKIRHLNQIYLSLEIENSIPKGELVAVGGIALDTINQLLTEFEGRIYLAMDNCPNQFILFGSPEDLATVTQQLKVMGGICSRLPFDRAYHTALFAPVGVAFRAFYNALNIGAGHTPLYSCATCAPFPSGAEDIRMLATQQWSSQVRFRETVLRLYEEVGIKTFIEIGPSSNLTSFITDILTGKEHLAIASNIQKRTGLEQLQHLLGRLLVKGHSVDFSPLYRPRDLKIIDLSVSATPVKPKPQPVLPLNMPIMRLSSDFSIDRMQSLPVPLVSTDPSLNEPSLSEISLSASKTLAEKSFQLPSSQNSHPSPPIEASPIADQKPSAQLPLTNASNDTRVSLVLDHFQIMEEFLANQGRVTGAVYSHLANIHLNSNNPAVLTPAVNPLTFEESWPLLGKILEQDEQHLSCERQFTIDQDLFLHDHTIGGVPSHRHPELLSLPVIPFTVSMEIVAEAAACLFGGSRIVTGMSNLRGYRWLSLDTGTLTLRISAILQPQNNPQIFEVQVRLFQLSTSKSNQYHLVFEGIVTLASQFAIPPSPLSFALTQPKGSRWKDSELYSTGMFHGSMFQGVKHIRRWGQEGIEADLQVIPIDNFFSKIARPVFQTDAGLLDAGGQLLGYWVSEQFGSNFNVFPFQVKAFYQYAQPLPSGSMVCCRGLIRFNEERQAIAQFDFLDDFGQVIARFEGWQDRCFSVPDHFYQCRLQPQTSYLSQPWFQTETQLITRRIPPFPEGFLSDSWGIWQRVLVHLVLNQNERDIWYSLPEKGCRRTDWLLGRIAAKDAVRQWAQALNLQLAPADIEIGSTQLGQPIVICPELATLGLVPTVSISHSQQYIVAGLSPPRTLLGIDLQRLERLKADDLLVTAMTDREIKWLQQLPPLEKQVAIIEFWCAKEAAAKALGKGLGGNSRNWEVYIDFQGQREVKVSHEREVLLVKLWRFEEEILAICQHSQLAHLPK